MPRPPARLSNCYVPLVLEGQPQEKAKNITATTTSSSGSNNVDTTSVVEIHQRADLRQPHELRQLSLETSVLQSSLSSSSSSSKSGSAATIPQLGSSLVELGHTKVLCQVTLATSHPDASPDRGILECQVQYAPHIGKEETALQTNTIRSLDDHHRHSNNGNSINDKSAIRSQEFSFSRQLHSSLTSTVAFLQDSSRSKSNQRSNDNDSNDDNDDDGIINESFAKCCIHVHVTILQDDGSVLSTCITAATLALVDARIELFDMVTSCSVAVLPKSMSKNGRSSTSAVTATKSNQQTSEEEKENIIITSEEFLFLADPTQSEQDQAIAILCLAMTPNQKEVTLWSQSGRLETQPASTAIDLCRNGCRTMHKFMRQHVVSKHAQKPQVQ